jgi:Fe-S-cluster containining protein
MEHSVIHHLLANYLALRNKVDELCRAIGREFAPHIACRAGCDLCCRHLSLFPVEAFALADAVRRLAPDTVKLLRNQAATASADSACPLLQNKLCLLYDVRPIICRTHGLPLVYEQDGRRQVDCCPDNFRDLDSLPGSAVIGLDQLNTTLAAVNAVFIGELERQNGIVLPPRMTIADALLVDFDLD